MPPPPPSCASSFPSRNHHHTDITIRSNHNNLSGNIPTTSSGAPFLRQLQRSVEGAGPAFADRGLRCSRVFSKSSFQGCWASSCYCGEGILVLRAWALFPESEPLTRPCFSSLHHVLPGSIAPLALLFSSGLGLEPWVLHVPSRFNAKWSTA